MARRHYRAGDSIVLKQGILGSAQPLGPGSILSVLPAAQGFVHYRVRFQNENYERSIRQDDIDVLASPSSFSPIETQAIPENSKSSWINSDAIRTKR
ncbi:cold-shock protein [Rhizobium sp. R72]|uniref:cold-shock protein n=1 Tax=unclassified Rhizobium TaxID=2613769 RepID=UPI000B535067|nr:MULTISPECIES: cold-shock protein [unclassified Rhizobium]OWW05057.1 cold-shock protein [Rhizobium sp. R72]OWW06114.1 cold-shock protein [Rhizobium sp. R711]